MPDNAEAMEPGNPWGAFQVKGYRRVTSVWEAWIGVR